MTLYPTKTRLQLLEDVFDGNVERQYRPSGLRDFNRTDKCVVTSRMNEAFAAEWAVLGEIAVDKTERFLSRPWRLTDAGLAVLRKGGAS